MTDTGAGIGGLIMYEIRPRSWIERSARLNETDI
jgi:hypothetical protein